MDCHSPRPIDLSNEYTRRKALEIVHPDLEDGSPEAKYMTLSTTRKKAADRDRVRRQREKQRRLRADETVQGSTGSPAPSERRLVPEGYQDDH